MIGKVPFTKSSHIFRRSIISQSWLANPFQVSYVSLNYYKLPKYFHLRLQGGTSVVAKDCGFDFIVRNLTTKLLHTATLYQVKSYLQIKPIKISSNLDWRQMRVVSKVKPFLLTLNIESNGK